MSEGGLKFAWGKKAAVAAVPKPTRPGSSGMSIAQEAAVNQGDLKLTTPEEEEKRRKRLEAWKKLQAENPEAAEPADDQDQKMAQVRAALKEVNKRNRDLGVRKSKKKRKRSSSSDDVMITSTDNADVIITQADAKARGGRGQGPGAPAAGGLIDLDDEGPVDSEAEREREREQQQKLGHCKAVQNSQDRADERVSFRDEQGDGDGSGFLRTPSNPMFLESRGYLPQERRSHAAHYDGHAFATAVLGLSDPSGYEGGLYLQPGPQISSRRTVRLEPGDLLVHSFDLQHGVEVTQGSRYSLIFWLKDSPEAVATGTTPWYEEAAAAGEPDALYNLGIQHELGLHGQEINVQKAKEAYLRSAELGHHFSQNNLALLYQEHPELDVDRCGSLHWMRLAAASGFAVAQKNLGTMLMEEGNSELAAESRQWLRRAAEQREPEAAFFLGEIYREGLGVAPDLSEAQRWYRESTALGFFPAATELGLLAYEAGSFAEAEQHLEAAVQGDAEAWGYLATVRMCLGKGSSAAAIWQRLADRGDAEAQFHLGSCFLRGSGVGADEERALQLLQASCDAGNERAAALLQELNN
ncbi:esiB, partial [Symbiodinium sp. CCMP2456]